MHSYHHPALELRETPGRGRGLYARERIEAGALLVVTGGRVIDFDTLASFDRPGHPFQVEVDLLLAPTDDEVHGIFAVNHSCSPNAGLSGSVSLRALRPIEAGEEVTYDYVMTDSDPAGAETFGMDCGCGAPDCRGRVTDRDWRDAGLRARYAGSFSPYLERRIRASA